ncbi:hypothetical protein [Streptomyces sp. WMMC897]|uniref:hypothetical protein n=1 Tax=Streptomyces sp. WMMC897 TaxID=3014782 RepID=UPI0022B61890|nr:hypothetical protein [Streptomyces sp. WMMC897]MCZ7413060.1 hypothetical protein [Streptomyces sp. WMMC897]MCZ7413148.1 hypothetical protein [Streptomyces sp. WMMC897]MCZ7415468.1 hypothetical protein [Streptomyces sp. WMMC897]
MDSVFGNLGVVGLAVALTAILLVGIKGGGKLKPLGWWPCLILGMLAGSAYAAAGGLFSVVPELIGDGIELAQGMVPGLGMGALALTLAIVIFFKKLTTMQVAISGIVFWYVAAGAGGVWSTVADAIANLGDKVA